MSKGNFGRNLLVLALVLVCLFAVPQAVFAAPEGGTVTSGNAAIDQSMPGVTNITQFTDRLILNWEKYGIGLQELVRYLQPNDLAVALNRVTGVDPSIILGSLQSNGRIFIINPNGILFGSQSRVDVGGLLATTLTLSDKDFLNGNYAFVQDPAKGLSFVVNKGQIKAADGGYVVLVAPLVNNEGTIIANLGHVVLAGGSKATVTFDAQGLVNFSLPANDGPTGNVVMSTEACADVLRQTVNQQGIVEAGEVLDQDGKVILVHAEGLAVNSGTIQANGAAGSDAGTILLHSTGATITTADSKLEARGLGENSNGGFIETSTHGMLSINSAPNASAQNGHGGTWLIDPNNIEIVAGANSNMGGGPPPAAYVSTGNTAQLIVTAITGALDAGTSVTVQTMSAFPDTELGDITVSVPIVQSAALSGTTLTLIALHDIIINAGISSTSDTLSLDLQATNNVTVGGVIDLNGGSFTSAGVNFTNTVGNTITTGGGSVDLSSHSGAVAINAAIDASGGGSFTSAGTTFTSGAAGTITADGGVDLTGHSDAVLIGAAVDLTGGAGGGFSSSGTTFTSGAAGTISTDGGGTVDLSGHTGAVIIGGAVTTSGGGGTFSSSGTTFASTDTITADGGVDLTGHSGTVAIGAAVDLTGGAGGGFSSSGTSFTSGAAGTIGTDGGGAITINHSGAVTIGANIDSGAAGSDTYITGLSISRTAGVIYAAGLSLDATGGSVGALGTPIRTDVTTIAARATNNIYINDDDTTSADNLDINSVNALNGLVTSANDGIISLTSSANIAVNQPIAADGTGNVTLRTTGGAGDITTNGTVTSTSGAITFESNTIVLGANVQSTGALILQPNADGTNIGIGDAAAGTFSLDGSTEIPFLQPGFSSITIGRSTGTGILEVNNTPPGPSLTFSDPLVLRAPGVGGSINVIDGITDAAGITFMSDTITIGAAILGPSTLEVSTGNTIGIVGGAGNFQLNQATIDFLQAGGDTLVIGNPAGTGTITIGALTTFHGPVTIQAPGAGGAIVVNGNIVDDGGSGTLTLDGSGATTTLNADIITNGVAINIADSVLIAAATVTLDTTNAGGTPAGAAITITGTTNSAGAANSLTLNSGTGAAIDLQSSVGNSAALGTLTVTQSNGATFTGGGANTFNAATVIITDTQAGQTVAFPGSTSITTGLTVNAGPYDVSFTGTANTVAGATTFNNSGTVTLGDGALDIITFTGGLDTDSGPSFTYTFGTVRTAANPILIGPSSPAGLTLNGDTTLDTTNGGLNPLGSGITVTATTQSAATFNYNLVLQAGTAGAITLQDTVGDVDALASLNATGATISLQAVTTTGLQTYTGDATINGGLTSNTAGAITLTGATTLGADLTIQTAGIAGDDILFNGAGTIDGVQALTLDAGLGNVTIGGNVGDTNPLTSIDVTGAVIDLQFVETTGAQTYTGDATLNGDLTSNTAGAITLTGATTLGADLTITTAGAVGDNIWFTGAGTIDGGQTLNLDAGLANITIDGIVGGTPLTSLVILNAADVSLPQTTITGALNQTTGTGTTTFNAATEVGSLNMTSNSFLVNGTILSHGPVSFNSIGAMFVNQAITTDTGGTVTITNGGLLTIAAAGDMNLDGAFLQNGAGLVSTAGDITTTNDNITFTTGTTLTGNVLLNTGAGIGNITFLNILDGGFDLGLTAGTGNVVFGGAVGGVARLGALTVTSAA
ncbi:MAG: filamentous hemagglutinin N-terminal domain-containing protein, partial [bacterium]